MACRAALRSRSRVCNAQSRTFSHESARDHVCMHIQARSFISFVSASEFKRPQPCRFSRTASSVHTCKFWQVMTRTCFSPRPRFEHGARKVDVCNFIATGAFGFALQVHQRLFCGVRPTTSVSGVNICYAHVNRRELAKGMVELRESSFDNNMSPHGIK
eukprot:6187381-Pleurochrysis_carterae.AAC.7